MDFAGEARDTLAVAVEGSASVRIPLSALGVGRTVTCDALGPAKGVLDAGQQLTGMLNPKLVLQPWQAPRHVQKSLAIAALAGFMACVYVFHPVQIPRCGTMCHAPLTDVTLVCKTACSMGSIA